MGSYANYKNKTNHPMLSNSHLLVTANKAIHLKGGGGYKTNGNIIKLRQIMKRCTQHTFRKIIPHQGPLPEVTIIL